MPDKEIFQLGELFERVQLEEVFPDSKTFVDCTPQLPLEEINKLYDEQKDIEGFSLSEFINKYFREPITKTTDLKEGKPILAHLDALWDRLVCEPESSDDSLITLPHNYVIPGGRFREIYYWDSYFTMLGLEVSNRYDNIENMVKNFAFLLDQYSFIPNGNRTYYLGRSQPPFFSCMIQLLTDIKGNDILINYLPQLIKEYTFWMKNRSLILEDGSVLNIYSDKFNTPRPESFKEDYKLIEDSLNPKKHAKDLRAGAESGWDFSSRWFMDENDFASIHTTDIIPVDLNCLLYNLEVTIANAYLIKNEDHIAEQFITMSNKRKDAINKFCWKESVGYYFDYDHIRNEHKTSYTLAGVFPLFFEIATEHQAIGVKEIIEQKFLKPGGLVTTMANTGQQWDAPNGWAPLQWIAIKGLLNYGFEELAKDIADRWMLLNEKVYYATGKMMEKYNVEDITLLAGGGEYPAQDGFGWTNGVYLKLHSLFK